MSTELITPIRFFRQSFIITQEIINNKFIILDSPVIPESVNLKIENMNDYIEEYQYQVIKIINENIELFPGAELNSYVVTWKDNWTVDCTYLFPIIDVDKLGSIIEVKYISEEEQVITEDEINQNLDEVNWEV
jgi:hypothetical protein